MLEHIYNGKIIYIKLNVIDNLLNLSLLCY